MKPGSGIDITIIGNSAGVYRMLLHMEEKLSGPSLGWFMEQKVDPYLRVRARARFRSEGDDATGKWVPLVPATHKFRTDQGYGPSHPINKRSGRLENFITHGPNKLVVSPGNVLLTIPDDAPSGQLESRMLVAQKGDTSKGHKGRGTARPVVAMNERDLFAVLSLLAGHIEGQS